MSPPAQVQTFVLGDFNFSLPGDCIHGAAGEICLPAPDGDPCSFEALSPEIVEVSAPSWATKRMLYPAARHHIIAGIDVSEYLPTNIQDIKERMHLAVSGAMRQTRRFPPESASQCLSWLFTASRAMHAGKAATARPACKVIPKLADFTDPHAVQWIDGQGCRDNMGEVAGGPDGRCYSAWKYVGTFVIRALYDLLQRSQSGAPLAQPACGGLSLSPRRERPVARKSVGREGLQLARQWRADRRERLRRNLDWSRYHLQVCFVDACEPSFAEARLSTFFFKRACRARGDQHVLCCDAGGLCPALGARDAGAARAICQVPGVSDEELGLLAEPLEQFELRHMEGSVSCFVPRHVDLYDVVVAANEESYEALSARLHGRGASSEHLCALGDFLDAHDALQAQEAAEGLPVASPGRMAPGFATREAIEALREGRLEPGPLRGAPPRRPVGELLGGLPREWQPLLDAASDLGVAEGLLEGGRGADARRTMGSVLRSAVGLHRWLMASIPADMKWWNDEAVGVHAGQRRLQYGSGGGWADQLLGGIGDRLHQHLQQHLQGSLLGNLLGGGGLDPYGQQQAPYGQQQAPYGQQQDPYGQQQAPYGQQQGPYGQQQAPYGQQQQAPVDDEPWMIGGMFLENFATVFDFDQGVMGFAEPAGSRRLAQAPEGAAGARGRPSPRGGAGVITRGLPAGAPPRRGGTAGASGPPASFGPASRGSPGIFKSVVGVDWRRSAPMSV
ncbi:unnamed protein product [Prorocentrum cordatum]|uniref:Uncharacterized protein n=1 Tax=Prorocentrum cordatum TaxID=2364126 RepID=A0ABN9TAT0_9DINO|nr:unnamed protein product [Polarella glacialis]